MTLASALLLQGGRFARSSPTSPIRLDSSANGWFHY